MNSTAQSIRAFIGAKNFEVSRSFYQRLGFEELVLSPTMSYFKVNNQLGFYLQSAYVKDWVDNLMLFLEVEDVEVTLEEFQALSLTTQFEGVRLSTIQENDWGREFFLHDPSGVLWHIGAFV
jgi:hypothetical protein